MNQIYLTPKERLQFSLSPQLKENFIGLILGDFFLQKRSENTLSVRALFKQGVVNKDYLMHLYELFRVRIRLKADSENLWFASS
jgi:hypothetical protein